MTYFAGMLGLMVVVVVASGLRRSEMRRAWRAFASANRLHVLDRPGGGIEVRGSYQGFHINVGSERRDQLGTHRDQMYTFLQVQVPHEIGGGFRLKSEGLGAKALKMAGGEDLQVGDAAFDKAFLIQADFPNQMMAFLEPPRVRQALLTLRDKHPNMVFDEHYLSLELYGARSFTRTHKILEDFLQCARALKAAHQTRALPQDW